MLNRKFKIKDTVDVFVSETESPDKVLIIFHKMTTRDRIELLTSKAVAELLALLTGKESVRNILKKFGSFEEDQAVKLFQFLSQQHLIVDFYDNANKDPRYNRQVAYFDDMILDRPGRETQRIIESKKVVILGCGAVGSAISEVLVRAGVSKIVLVDYKQLTMHSIDRHFFATANDVGKNKVDVLAAHLTKINSKLSIETYCDMLLPDTNLSVWVTDDSSIVINGCDEPYIGHTSLKIGRYLSNRGIALYVMGGFDAHLMSSGELIFPPKTPCIDCAQKTFTKALGDWKPVYSAIEISKPDSDLVQPTSSNYVAGGPGGMAMISGFSANLAALAILQFLAEDSKFDYEIRRYEYLINNGSTTEFKLEKQAGCHVCNK